MAAALYASMMTETAQTASATGITTSISSYVDCFFSVLVVCNAVHDAAIDCRHAGRPARQRHGSGRRDLGDPGFIRYTGPRLRILNRPGVERSVHACYFGVKKEYDRLLPLIAKSLHQLDTLRQPHATTEPRRSRLVLADLGQQVVQESVPDDPLFDCFTHGLLAA
jgi:hypothetical protein